MPEALVQYSTSSLEDLRVLANEGRLFAVLDACDAPAVPILAEGLGPGKCVSLYRGDAEELYADIAPYLVKVEGDNLVDWLLQFSATEGWGILVVSDQPIDTMRQHLRQFLRVLDPEGKPMYFRFYDPRVLETFLPTCDSAQLAMLFGPVRNFGTLGVEGRVSLLGLTKQVGGRIDSDEGSLS